MKYEDQSNYVNGLYVGVKIGAAMRDAADPTNDGYSHLRDVEHIGTIIQDSAETNPQVEKE